MNDTLSPQTTDQNERILAALSHATALIPMVGVIAPIVIWATQKDKSEYVAFQALQAIVYQFIMIVAYFIGMMGYILSIPVMIFFGELGSNRFSDAAWIFPMLIMVVIFGGGAFFILYGGIAAVMAFLGRKFRYILIGVWIEKTMQKNLS
ncbi:MAG: DUF4870 domain-containing protein [Anaerolineales bacterium]|nr:DUF4870 domain-containing protein [Anaerolineales bacterium]